MFFGYYFWELMKIITYSTTDDPDVEGFALGLDGNGECGGHGGAGTGGSVSCPGTRAFIAGAYQLYIFTGITGHV